MNNIYFKRKLRWIFSRKVFLRRKFNSLHFDIFFIKMDNRKLQISEKNEISGTAEIKGNGFIASTEERNYNLNTTRSMGKKLKATARCDMEITDTGGGIKLMFTAGTYELIKFATDKLFTQDDMKGKCERIPVLDKKKNLVETKYKVSTGKHTHYCLNMYHTKCLCLVNGKGTLQFMQTDIHDIFSVIQNKLTDENCSLSDFNNSVKELILEYCNVNNEDGNNNEEAKSEETIINEVEFSRPTSLAVCPQSPNASYSNINAKTPDIAETIEIVEIVEDDQVETNESTSDVSTETMFYDMLQSIQTAVTQVQKTLDDHIENTGNQFLQIRDEMSRIKNQSSLNSNITDRQIETLSDNSNEVRTDIDRFSTTLQKRLQTMFESLKALHRKTSTAERKESNCPTASVTAQSENITKRGGLDTSVNDQSSTNIRQDPFANGFGRKTITKQTLLVGDSILKGIQTRGLNSNIHVRTLPGATTKDVAIYLRNRPMDDYDEIVIYVGGNDQRSRLLNLNEELKKTIQYLKETYSQMSINLCSVCPRSDVNVSTVNELIQKLAPETRSTVIDVHGSFVYGMDALLITSSPVTASI